MIGTDRPACEFDMTCQYDDPEVTPPENGGDDDNGDGGDDNGDSDDTDACTPTPLPEATTSLVLTFADHPLPGFNGRYCADGANALNGVVPFRKADGTTFYYFGVWGSWCWHWSATPGDGSNDDASEGGYSCWQ